MVVYLYECSFLCLPIELTFLHILVCSVMNLVLSFIGRMLTDVDAIRAEEDMMLKLDLYKAAPFKALAMSKIDNIPLNMRKRRKSVSD